MLIMLIVKITTKKNKMKIITILTCKKATVIPGILIISKNHKKFTKNNKNIIKTIIILIIVSYNNKNNNNNINNNYLENPQTKTSLSEIFKLEKLLNFILILILVILIVFIVVDFKFCKLIFYYCKFCKM